MYRFVRPLLSADQREQIDRLPENLVLHNISQSLPFDDASVDAVYHSHLLEHIPRANVEGFLEEVRRILVPGGVQRICVPDLEKLVRDYVSSLSNCRSGLEDLGTHDASVSALYEQSVRRQGYSGNDRSRLMLLMERVILGDARRRGELHLWMYDEINLKSILADAGFSQIVRCEWNVSSIADWVDSGLEVGIGGKEYRPGSLYVEARK